MIAVSDNIPLFYCTQLKIGIFNCRSNKIPATALKGNKRTGAALIITRCYGTQEPRIYCIHDVSITYTVSIKALITVDTEGYSLPEGRQGTT